MSQRGGDLVLQVKTGDKEIAVKLVWDFVEYQFKELYAKHKTNRIAKSGEVLYLVDPPSVSDTYKEVRYGITTNPKTIDESKIRNIKWYKDENRPENQLAINTTEIARNIKEDDNTTTYVYAGNPNHLTKGIGVKWVGRDYRKTKFTIGTSSNPFLKKALEASKTTEKVTKYFNKIPFIKKVKDKAGFKNGSIGYYFNVVPFMQVTENIEDANSRLYYTDRQISGGFNLGMKGSVTIWTWGLPTDKLPIPGWVKTKVKDILVAEVNVVAKASVGGELMIKTVEKKWVESKDWKQISHGVNPAIVKLNMAFGVESEISLLKSYDWFSISGRASGLANAEILRFGYFDSEFNYQFLYKGVYIDIQASAYVVFMGKKLETTPYFIRKQIIKPNRD